MSIPSNEISQDGQYCRSSCSVYVRLPSHSFIATYEPFANVRIRQVRRWQIRFHNTDDFIKAVDIFRSLGLPLTERSADATPIPQPINLLGVGDHRSTSRNIGNAVCVPASSAQSSRISELKAMNRPIASPSPILLENSAPGRPSSGSSETLRSSSAIGDQVEQGARPSSTTSLKLSPIPRSLTEASQYSQKTVKDKRPMLKLQLQKVVGQSKPPWPYLLYNSLIFHRRSLSIQA